MAKLDAEAAGPGAPAGLDPAKLGAALEAGASEAATKAPRTSDPAKLKLTTRKFIKADLQVSFAYKHTACHSSAYSCTAITKLCVLPSCHRNRLSLRCVSCIRSVPHQSRSKSSLWPLCKGKSCLPLHQSPREKMRECTNTSRRTASLLSSRCVRVYCAVLTCALRTSRLTRLSVLSVCQPALISVDKHRPDDAQMYLATFLSTAVAAL